MEKACNHCGYRLPRWSEWRDLNSRPLDPQSRFDARHQIFYSSKSRFHKNAESLDTSMFFALLLYHTSAANTIFFVQFQKKKAHKSAQIFEVCALFVRQENRCSLFVFNCIQDDKFSGNNDRNNSHKIGWKNLISHKCSKEREKYCTDINHSILLLRSVRFLCHSKNSVTTI